MARHGSCYLSLSGSSISELGYTQAKKTAKHCFRLIAARTPDIGSLRENSHRMNLTGGMVWLAFYKATPEKISDDCFRGLITAAMSAPPVKASYTINKDKMFTPKGIIQRKARLEGNNLASNNPFNWRAEVILGRAECVKLAGKLLL